MNYAGGVYTAQQCTGEYLNHAREWSFVPWL